MPRFLTSLWPSTLAQRLFLIITFLEMLVNVVIMSILMAKGQLLDNFFDTTSANERRTLPVYLGLFAVAHIFQLVLAAEAIVNRNTIQIIGLVLFNGLFLAYAGILVGEVRGSFDAVDATPGNARVVDDASVTVLITIVPIVIGLTELAYIILARQLYNEFGWQIFKSLGADRKIRRFFLVYQVFVCILKFDWFFFLAFSLQFIFLVLNRDDIEYYLTIAAAPISLLVLVLGYFAVRRENRPLTFAFMTLCAIGAGYFAFKLLRIYVGSQVDAYLAVRKSLTVFSALSLTAMVCTVTVASLCMRNFNKGLRFHLMRPKASKAAEAGYADDRSAYSDAGGPHYKLSSAAGSRLSID